MLASPRCRAGRRGQPPAQVADAQENLRLPSHRWQLGQFAASGAFPAPPERSQVWRRRRRRRCSCGCCCEDWEDSLSDGDYDEYAEGQDELGEVRMEAEAGDLAARFPRRLRLSGLSTTDLRKRLKVHTEKDLPEGLLMEAYEASTDMPHLDLPLRGLFGENLAADHAASSEIHGGAASERRRAVNDEVVRRFASLDRVEFRYAGLFARTYCGAPAWVAKYVDADRWEPSWRRPRQRARRHHRGAEPKPASPCDLEVIVLKREDGRCGEGRVLFELSMHFEHSLGREPLWLPPLAREQLRFFYRCDSSLIPVSTYLAPAILRGEAEALDLLFRTPASVPRFRIKEPRPQHGRVAISLGREFEGSRQLLAGQVYRYLHFNRSRQCPSELHLQAMGSELSSRLAGVYRQCSTRRRADRAQGELGAPAPRPASASSYNEQAVLRMSEVMPADLRLGGPADEPELSSDDNDVDEDDEGSIGSLGSHASDSEASEFDDLMELDGDENFWTYYVCEEKRMFLCPLLWRDGEGSSSDSDDSNAGESTHMRDAQKRRARWLFIPFMGATPERACSRGNDAAEISTSSSSSGPAVSSAPADAVDGPSCFDGLFEGDLRRSLSSAIAWLDIPGDKQLAGEFSVAFSSWQHVPGARLTPVFLRDDNASRDVVVPSVPLHRPAERWPDARQASVRWADSSGQGRVSEEASLTRTKLQLLQSSLGLYAPGSKALWMLGTTYKAAMQLLKRSLPKGSWVAEEDLKPNVRRILRVDMVLDQRLGREELANGGLVGAIRPAHQQCLNQVPSSLQGWMVFGDSEPIAEVAESMRRSLMHPRARYWDWWGDRSMRALKLEFSMRPGRPCLLFRVCARPGVLLKALLGTDLLRPAEKPGETVYRFDWRVESRRPVCEYKDVGTCEDVQATLEPGVTGTRVIGGPSFIIQSNSDDPLDPQPAGFVEHPLRPEQLRTLSWMRRAEHSDEPFEVEREVIDDQYSGYSAWRVRGRLRISTRVQGGVLGDKVGYGKTATTIGLVVATRNEEIPKRSYNRPLSNCIPSRATLVLCPVNLVAQWVGEVTKFVHDGLRVVALQTFAQLKRLSVEDLESADMVIASYRLFYSEAYLGRLRALAVDHTGARHRLKGIRRPRLPNAVQPAHKKSKLRKRHRSMANGQRRRGGLDVDHLRSQQGDPVTLNWPPKDPHRSHYGWRRRGLQLFERSYARVFDLLCNADFAVAEDTGADAASRHTCAPAAKRRLVAGKKIAGSGGVEQPTCRSRPRKTSRRICSHAPPLELFYWKRIVLDEFHELLSGQSPAQVAVRYLRSQYRWGLSGTPPCKTAFDVAKMAHFFGIQLRPASPMYRPSSELCQRWLDRFARRNTAGLPELRVEEELVIVQQHPAERALYLQLAQAASDADLAGEDDAAVLQSLRRRGIEGLVKMCSHFQLNGAQLQRSAIDECDAVLQRRRRDVVTARAALPSLLEEARLRLEDFGRFPAGLFDGLMDHGALSEDLAKLAPGESGAVASASAGDAAATRGTESHAPTPATARSEARAVAKAKAKAKVKSGCGPKPKRTTTAVAIRQLLRKARVTLPLPRPAAPASEAQASLQRRLAAFRRSSVGRALFREALQSQERVVAATSEARRGARLLEARVRLVQYFETTVRAARGEESMRCPICLDDTRFAERSILPCAHLGCSSCMQEVAKRTAKCPVCRAPALPAHVMRLTTANEETEAPSRCGRYGSKIERLLELLSELSSQEPEARFILFVQWDDLKRKVANALAGSGVPHAVLQGNVWARQRVIRRFQQQGSDGSDGGGPRVLLLSLQDASSGTNLTAANHVILFHPMISSSRQSAVAREMQAVGRAVRAGQTRTVRIWRLVVAGTAEQKITEDHQQELWERFRTGRGTRVTLTTVAPAPNSAGAARGAIAAPSLPGASASSSGGAGV